MYHGNRSICCVGKARSDKRTVAGCRVCLEAKQTATPGDYVAGQVQNRCVQRVKVFDIAFGVVQPVPRVSVMIAYILGATELTPMNVAKTTLTSGGSQRVFREPPFATDGVLANIQDGLYIRRPQKSKETVKVKPLIPDSH